jgi:hypothetical protein
MGIFNAITYYITTKYHVLCDSTETLNTQQDAKKVLPVTVGSIYKQREKMAAINGNGKYA